MVHIDPAGVRALERIAEDLVAQDTARPPVVDLGPVSETRDRPMFSPVPKPTVSRRFGRGMLVVRRQPRVRRFEQLPLFSTCTRRQLGRIDNFATELTFGPEHVLQQEGTFSSAFIVLERGTARATQCTRRVGHLSPGDHFGGPELTAGETASVTITTETEVEVLVFGRVELRALLDVAPELKGPIVQARAMRG
jgi:CRP-like cAMP-binding protein